MSNLLSQLLAADEPLFTISLRELEDASGRTGQDARLISDIVQKVRAATKSLGLDPNDTTGTELYHAVMDRIRMHDEVVVRCLGGNDPADISALKPLVKQAAENSKQNRKVWVVKRSAAKRLLQNTPPPNLMKHLNYSSVDSMVKRENLTELFGALRFVETPAWQKRFSRSYKSLTPSDFEVRDIEIVILDKERWCDLADNFVRQQRHTVLALKELGAVLMLPTKLERQPGFAITTLPLVWHSVNEIRIYSAFFKHQQMRPGFGKIIAGVLNDEEQPAARLGSHDIHWRVVHRFYGQTGKQEHPEIFEPHIQFEDLIWHKAEDLLAEMSWELEFWKDLDYIGVADKARPVSFNLLDNAINYSTGAAYEQRVTWHQQGALWNELFSRYMGHKVLENQVLAQLQNGVIKPEKLVI